MASGLWDSFGASLIAYWRPMVRPRVDALARAEGIDLDLPRILRRVASSEERADASRPVTLEDTMIDAAAIVAGLGGAENIVEIEPCTTRLRTEVRDASLVDEAVLKRAGAIAVMRTGAAVQVIVGPEADTVASDIEELLE
jgi:PTS system N-acetylglucosamine-specific IIB component